MDYASLDEAGTLHIEYDGPPLDALTLGTFQIQLQFIVQQVALRLLGDKGKGQIWYQIPDDRNYWGFGEGSRSTRFATPEAILGTVSQLPSSHADTPSCPRPRWG
jgi:hypothetical protein